MTGNATPKSRIPFAPALLLAALAVSLLGGCLASRTPVPTPDQRTPEAAGRKARMEREAAEAAAAPAPKAEAAKPAVKPAAKPEPKVEVKEEAKAPAATPAATTEEAKPVAKPEVTSEAKSEAPAAPAEAAPTPATPVAKAVPAPALDAEQLPTKELTLQGQFVQIASFGTEKNAQNAVAWLAANGYPTSRVVRVEQGGNVLHRVQAGPFQDPAAARGALEALKGQWPQAFIPAD